MGLYKKLIQSINQENENLKEKREREIQRARMQLNNAEEVEAIKIALREKVRGFTSWQDSLEILMLDSRWTKSKLTKEEKRKIWEEHIHQFKAESIKEFRNLLSTSPIDLSDNYDKIEERIGADERWNNMEEEERKIEVKNYIQKMKREAVADFQKLLVTTSVPSTID